MAGAHCLAGRKRVGHAEVVGDIAVGVAPGGSMDTLLRRQAALLGRSLAYRVQVSGMDAAARIVAADLGPAVLPREAVESCMCRLPAWYGYGSAMPERGADLSSAPARGCQPHGGHAAAGGAPRSGGCVGCGNRGGAQPCLRAAQNTVPWAP